MSDVVQEMVESAAAAIPEDVGVSDVERKRRAAQAALRADPERMAISRLLGVPPREVKSWVQTDAGVVITLVNQEENRMIAVPGERPDGAGRAGLMILDPPKMVTTRRGPSTPRLAPGVFVFTPRPGDEQLLDVPARRFDDVIETDAAPMPYLPGRVNRAPDALARRLGEYAQDPLAPPVEEVLRSLVTLEWARTVLDQAITDEERAVLVEALVNRYRHFLYSIPAHQAESELHGAESWFADRQIDPASFPSVLPAKRRGLFGRRPGGDAA